MKSLPASLRVGGSRRTGSTFSVLPVAGNDKGKNEKSHQINTWLQAWCHWEIFEFSWVGLHNIEPADDRQSTPVSKEEKDLCTRIIRAH